MAETRNPRINKRISLVKWIAERLRPLSAMRDGLLVASGIVYVLGYLVWSLNAWINNLGLLPALEFQYFVAGVFPAVLVWSVYIGVKSGGQLMDKVATKVFDPGAKVGLRLLAWCIFIVYFVSSVGIIWRLVSWLIVMAVQGFPYFDLPLMLFFLVGALTGALLFGMDAGKSHWARLMSRFFWLYMVVMLFLIVVSFYLFIWYPRIPQALGGLRPSCVYLDVKKAELSSETLEGIFPAAARKSSSGVVRSSRLDLFFLSRDFIWVKRHSPKQDITYRVYKIKRDIVQAITSCVFGEEYELLKGRVAIEVDPKIYDAYVGQYELAPDLIATVTKEYNRLFAQATGRPKFELYPESETKFFARVADIQVTFVKNEKGEVTQLIVHQEGKDTPARKIK